MKENAMRERNAAYRISPMSVSDVDEVIGFLKRFSEVHFRPWEDRNLLYSVLSSRHNACYVARTSADAGGGSVIGALIAGSMGARATVNHLAVHPEYRRMGIARHLVGHALSAFQRQGICRVFLFIVEQANDARSFWAALGFKPVRNELTCELDIPQPASAPVLPPSMDILEGAATHPAPSSCNDVA